MLLPIRECPIASTWNSIIFRLQFSATTVLMDESMETSRGRAEGGFRATDQRLRNAEAASASVSGSEPS